MKNEKLKALKTLENGKGLQYLLNEAHKILLNPILMHDMEYKIIAYTENIDSDDPIWNEFISTSTVSPYWINFYKEENFFDICANAKKVTFLTSDKLKYSRIFGKLFNDNNIQIGCVCITESEKPFGEDDLELFECLCDKLNKELAKTEHFHSYGQEYQETLINNLLEASIQDKKLYTAHVESVYMNLKANLSVAVADINQGKPDYALLKFLRDSLKKMMPDYRYSIYNNYIVIIMSTDKVCFDKEDFKRLGKLLEQYNIHIGVSNSFENLFELRKYYAEALEALKSCKKNNSRIHICE